MHGPICMAYYGDIINRQFGDYFAKQICKKYFVHKHYVPKASTDIKIETFCEENGGMRLWVTKWNIFHIVLL